MMLSSFSSGPHRGAPEPRKVSNCRAPRISIVAVGMIPHTTVPPERGDNVLERHARKIRPNSKATAKDPGKSVFQAWNGLQDGRQKLDWSGKSSRERKNRQEPGSLGGPRTRSDYARWQALARRR